MSDVYLQSLGAHFPGPPISNEAMEAHLGLIGGRPSRARTRVLRQNGIVSRHYGIGPRQESRTSNVVMAASAAEQALQRAGLRMSAIDSLSAATTQGDLVLPGFASLLHQRLGGGPLAVDSLHGVCASGVMALRAAWLNIKSGQASQALAVASEFPSRLFKASRFEAMGYGAERPLPFDCEFLRWMLSDGAGAAVLGAQPNRTGLSLRLDWVSVTSFASQYPLAMVCGTEERGGLRGGDVGKTWLDYPDFAAAAKAGALNLNQDVRLLSAVVELGVAEFFKLIEAGKMDPSALDWMVCHYSSLMFRSEIFRLLELGGVAVKEEQWFSNLSTRGNVGSASCLVLLEELLRDERVRPGQSVALIVPESGGAIMAYAHLTVVDADGEVRSQGVVSHRPDDGSRQDQKSAAHAGGQERQAVGIPAVPAPELKVSGSEVSEHLVRQLTAVWADFSAELAQVPLLRRLHVGSFTLEDYKALLINLRQQVVEGGRWIARAASHISIEAFPLRSLFIGHAQEEHRDYQMLERDYVAVGGALEEIVSRDKNVGSEALSAWMFHQASQPNPFDLLGAMFIIEGLGLRIASSWGKQIAELLQLGPEQTTFLSYHGDNDPTHLEKLEKALQSPLLTPELSRRIVKTAKVTARLYRLQLEEVDRV